MSTIVIRRKHALGLARAKRLAETIARQLQDDYGGSFSWIGDDLRFQRTGASGSVAVTKDGLQVRVELSFLLSALRSRIEREIVTFCDEKLGEPDRLRRGQATRRAERHRKDAKSS